MTQVDLLPEGQTRLLDRYQIIGTIARGGMGTVSLARLAGVGGFQRLVAIKELHAHLAGEREFVDMFLDEARLAAGIHHQNVVSILEIGSSEDGLYLVMEYIEGASLARLAVRARDRGRSIPRPIAFRVLLDTLAGLHAAHELCDPTGAPLSLVHRDCSPQNVLLGVDGATKITDFGVARASSRLATTREGSFKGKLAYMAPEQTQGDELDRRADLFSLGIMMWELLTERRLFRAKSDAETLNRLLHLPIPRPSEVEPSVPAPLDDFCARALERDPQRRFQTAEEMAHALEQAARDVPVPDGDYPIALVRSVARFVTDLIGDDITEQRESVRTWLAKAGSAPLSGPAASRPSLDSLDSAPGEPEAGDPRTPVSSTDGSRKGSGSDESTLPRTVRSVEAPTAGRRWTWLLAVVAGAAALSVVWWVGRERSGAGRGSGGQAAFEPISTATVGLVAPPERSTAAFPSASSSSVDSAGGAPSEGEPRPAAGSASASSSALAGPRGAPPLLPPARPTAVTTAEPAPSEPSAATSTTPLEPHSNPYR